LRGSVLKSSFAGSSFQKGREEKKWKSNLEKKALNAFVCGYAVSFASIEA
jgi:hypothetical protein